MIDCIQEVIRMTIGDRLKEARKYRGYTQDTLAEKIGASRGVITNIEHNKIEDPQPMVITAICNALHISKDWLLNGEGTMELSEEAVKNAKLLLEINAMAEQLSEEEQRYILDIIKSYQRLASHKEGE